MTWLRHYAPAHAALGRLLDAASLKEAFVGGILPDVGDLTLLGGVDLRMRSCLFLGDFGFVTWTSLTLIGGWYRRHMIVAGHQESLSWLCRWTVAPGQRTAGIIGPVVDAAIAADVREASGTSSA
jgi:hypothetical protein